MKAIIQKFYTAFANLDAAGMCACYHNEVVFVDPAFGTLTGQRANAMWQMLCKSQKDKGFSVEFNHVEATDLAGSAHWEAFYTFSKTGRKVHNKINAQFQFKDGLIIKHTDAFDLHAWAKQALGFKGWLLGGTGFFKKQLQQQTNAMLDKFIAKQVS